MMGWAVNLLRLAGEGHKDGGWLMLADADGVISL
jgi:hypothetical protein